MGEDGERLGEIHRLRETEQTSQQRNTELSEGRSLEARPTGRKGQGGWDLRGNEGAWETDITRYQTNRPRRA